MLGVVVAMLYDRDVRTGAGEFLATVERCLVGQEEMGYWAQISQGL